MVNKKIIRKVVAAIVLFLLPNAMSLAQCKESITRAENSRIEGIVRGADHYYRNLIIQDIALAAGISMQEVSIRLDYKLNITVDKCVPGRLDISVNPISGWCDPHLYREFDVSASLAPSRADLVFYLRNHLGIIFDSVMIAGVPLGPDTGDVFSRQIDISPLDGQVSQIFARAAFHYDKQAYDGFRDHVLIIDEYYAAAVMADSAYRLITNGFLSENTSPVQIFLRQAEIERIARYVHPAAFDSLTAFGTHDHASLTAKHRRLERSSTRYKTLFKQSRPGEPLFHSPLAARILIEEWLDWQDHYRRMAYHTEYKFINFFEDLAIPQFSNSALQQWNNKLKDAMINPWIYRDYLTVSMFLALTERAERFENAGSQMHALRYYEAAMKLAVLTHLRDREETALLRVCQMKQEVMLSYLRIAGLAAGKDNPGLAVQYFHRARDLYHSNHLHCVDKDTLAGFGRMMYAGFESKVPSLIGAGAFRKANSFLQEIKARCDENTGYSCPEDLTAWTTDVNQGLYEEMIRLARRLINRDELAEAEQLFKQAGAMRYSVRPVADERWIESRLRQMHYDDFIDEGIRYFNKEEYDFALYYFSKAYHFQQGNLLSLRKELPEYRRESSRHVIEKLFSDTRLKIWAHDLETARHYLEQAGSMLAEYRVASDDPLKIEYERLQHEVFTSECIAARDVYDALMEGVFRARERQDFMAAHSLAVEAVNHSLDHISCRIRDDRAWYQRVVLEPLSGFQQKEKALDLLAAGSPEPYLDAFRELNSYYSRQKLLEQGVVFISLKERVLRADDIEFLTGMYDHYVRMNDPEQCLALLHVLHEKGAEWKTMSGRQWDLAKDFAKADVKNLENETMPWEFMRAHVGTDLWFRPFRLSYKLAWIGETKGKFRYWPLIWKK
ncbi:MAG: hypothetical protein K0B08_07580 [Bacteroidales bacterium]|nr:hypothetical protein [Bacteroidales bacterium]